MGKGYRQGRLGEEIKRLIGELLLREIKDPRLAGKMVSVSAVEVTSDGSYATVFISILGIGNDTEEKEKEKEDVIAAFKSAKGLIKREIGKGVKIRHIPDLIFKIDTSLEYGLHISEVLDNLDIRNVKDDEEEAGDDEK